MGVSAIIKDGVITNQNTEDTEKAKGSGGLDKQAFLNLLVAQMKYQDPLEPTSNTEYVAQLATFSELEQMQNLAFTSELQRATSLVGSLVSVTKTDSTTGQTTEITGKIDYVSHTGSTVKVSINDQLYDLDDVTKVWDSNYADAHSAAEDWINTYESLPDPNKITGKNASAYVDTIQKLADAYNSMSLYERSFLSNDYVKGMQAYIDKMIDYGYFEDTTKVSGTDTSDDTSDSNESAEAEDTSEDVTPEEAVASDE